MPAKASSSTAPPGRLDQKGGVPARSSGGDDRPACRPARLHADDTTVPVLAPGWERPKPDGSGLSFATSGPGARWCHRRRSTLLGGSHGHPCGGAAWHLPGLSACRWICRVRTALPTDPPNGKPTLVEVSCWSSRRKSRVHHATASPIALEAFEQIAALFAIESGIRGRPSDQRGAAREEHARPLLVQLKTFLDTSLDRVSGKSALAQAIRYTLSRWQALTRYVTDGRLEMSNNAAERAMKPPSSWEGRTICSAAPTRVDSAPPASTASSRPPRCAASIRRPIWPMSSTASLTTRSAKSTPCSPGDGQIAPDKSLSQTKNRGQRLTLTSGQEIPGS